MNNQDSTSHVRPLTGRLVDEISEALLRPRLPHERSDVVCAMVEEVYENIRWLHGWKQTAELASLHELLLAARAHNTRMTDPDGVDPPHDLDQRRVDSGASSHV